MKKAPIDKLDIYVSAQNLFKKIYYMKNRISKADRKMLYPHLLDMAIKVAADVALAKRVKTKSLEYLETLIADFETLKLTLRSCVDLNIIKEPRDKAELFSCIALIDGSLDKWYSYKSDMINKVLLKRESEMRQELRKCVTEQLHADLVKNGIIPDVNVAEEKRTSSNKISLYSVKEFLIERPVYINKKIIEDITRNMKTLNNWRCTYGCSRDDVTKGSIHEISKKIAGLNDTLCSKGVGRHYAYIYKYEHGWLCISGTNSKSVTDFIVIGDNQFFKDWGKHIFYDEIDYECNITDCISTDCISKI